MYWKKSRLKKYYNMEAVDAIRKSGGLSVLWKKNFNLRVISKCSRFFEVEITRENSNKLWTCLLIYGELNGEK